ncbi:hypothetical protein BH20ACT5_BH20ACT5_05200 [soil metagenome]
MAADRDPVRSKIAYCTLATLALGAVVAVGLMALFELSAGVALGWTVLLAVCLLLLFAILVG